MSNYNPVPPRVWSRVQNPCTFIFPGDTYQNAYIPLTGQTVPLAQANYEMQMLNKGNVLQYKGNSARLTKTQKYSQLARCAGPNRTKVFATQSETYTNPNTTGLLRVGYSSYPYPNQIVGAPNNISGPFEYNVQNPFDCSSNSIQDGGTLVCGTYANPCSGEIIQNNNGTAIICNSASASDVPGSSVLCWNNKVQTWFPKQRYFMNNSTSKWPQGYKGFQSAVSPPTPINLTATYIISGSNVIVTLTWEANNIKCLPISSFNIYQNGRLIKTVPYYVNDTTITYSLIGFSELMFYVTALSGNAESPKSNEVTVNLPLIDVVASNYNTNLSNFSQFSNSGVIIFTNIGASSFNINYASPTLNFTLFAIGGGGSGGHGGNNGGGGFTGGSGGGGGGGFLNTQTLTGGIYSSVNFSINVGGSASGSSVSSTVITFTGNGGNNGSNGNDAPPLDYGSGGSGGSGNGSGGHGSDGGSTNDSNGSNGSPNYYTFTVNGNTYNIYFGGGGGGGAYQQHHAAGGSSCGGQGGTGSGGSGNRTGYGGAYNISSGISSIYVGGGGGGGSGTNTSNGYGGGGGSAGIVGIYWQ